MSQTLYLPMDEVTLNVGYRSEKYAQQYGCVQYGTDLSAPARMVHASARGTVEKISTDTDGTAYCVVRYDDVECADGEARTIYAKYGHLRRCQLDEGQEVEDGELLGSYEGGYLHVEMCLEYDPEDKPVFNGSSRDYGSTVAPYLVWQAREKGDPDAGLYAQTITTKKEWLEAGWVSPLDILDFSKRPEPEQEPDPDEDVAVTPTAISYELKYKALIYDLRALIKKYEG